MGKLNRPPEIKYCACNECGLEIKPGREYISGHNRRGKDKPQEYHPCECGCLELVKISCRFVKNHDKRVVKLPQYPAPLCECGCGEFVSWNVEAWNKFVNGGHSRRKIKVVQLCECGCGEYANPGCRYIYGHNGKDRVWTEEEKINLRGPKTEEHKLKLRKPKSEEGRANIKRAANTPSALENHRLATLKRYEDPKEREKQSKTITDLWANPEFREAQILAIGAGQDHRPNNPESLLRFIVRELYTGWKYTGDYSVVINGKNPDFVNEERKLIIEHYGDYWHKGEDPVDREEIFAQAGYETLVIWEDELNNNLDNVLYKLKLFHEMVPTPINKYQISPLESAILSGNR